MSAQFMNEDTYSRLTEISKEISGHGVASNCAGEDEIVPSFSQTFALEHVFEYEDNHEQPLAKDDFDKAYTLMKRKIDFGRDLIYARELVGFYKTAMLSKHSERASKACQELVEIMRKNTQSSATEIGNYAKKLESRDKFMESILFFQVASHYHLIAGKSRECTAGLALCCEGIRNASKKLLKQRSGLKPLVQHHILPVMQEMRRQVQMIRNSVSRSTIENEILLNCEVKCLHCCEFIEGRVGDYEGREFTLKEGIELVEAQLGANCNKHGVYSLLLNNLACTYEVMHRFEEACVFYLKSITAHRLAEDYQNEEQRSTDIASSERGWKRAKEKLIKVLSITRNRGTPVGGDC